jgi:hypothetical protein
MRGERTTSTLLESYRYCGCIVRSEYRIYYYVGSLNCYGCTFMVAKEWTIFKLNCLSAERALCRVFSIYMWVDHYIKHLLRTKYDWLDL